MALPLPHHVINVTKLWKSKIILALPVTKHNMNNLSGAGCIYVMSFIQKENKLALVKCTVKDILQYNDFKATWKCSTFDFTCWGYVLNKLVIQVWNNIKAVSLNVKWTVLKLTYRNNHIHTECRKLWPFLGEKMISSLVIYQI